MNMTVKENVLDFTSRYGNICRQADYIPQELFDEYGVQRGLRDKNGNGVLTGLTNISRIEAFKKVNGEKVPCDGKLWYRGYDVIDLVRGFSQKRYGFEETAYLLIFGKLPDKDELAEFKSVLGASRTLPTNFMRDVIMKAPSRDIMNSMTKSVLTLAAYDKNVSDQSIENVLRQSLNLIGTFPMLAVYGYHAIIMRKMKVCIYTDLMKIYQRLKIYCAC